MTAETFEAVWKIAAAVFGAGAVWAELKAVRKDIARLEQKVEKHNHFDRRIIRLETLVEVKQKQDAQKARKTVG